MGLQHPHPVRRRRHVASRPHRSVLVRRQLPRVVEASLSNGDDEDAATATRVGWQRLQCNGLNDDWLVQVHHPDPHTPCLEPGALNRRASEAGSPPSWLDEDAIAAHAEQYGPHAALDLYEGDGTSSVTPPPSTNPETMSDVIATQRDFEVLVDGHDSAVHYWDRHLGALLLQELAELGIADQTPSRASRTDSTSAPRSARRGSGRGARVL